MSRTSKPRMWRGHTYHSKHFTWPKRNGNKRARQEVRQKMKDILFTDAFDENMLPEKKEHIFDRWWYD